ncbi:ABC transporter permease subunit [[Mycoplasma] collis]|uniref:ABC transporter permease subunit n=1 Tax=[Mycoplasma] collis TaxID=2127 RepID=UPI00051AE374|nr:ABC transporter permease subunit [[Mycoplasma] collis]
MENIQLWNWYGHKFDKKNSIKKLDFYYYKQQIQNVFDRQKLIINKNKKRNKELFLEAKKSLENEKKRILKNLKITYSNDLNIAKQTIKELKISNNLLRLIGFEIKKINNKLLDSKKYVKNYFNLLKNTSDTLDTKINIINNLIIEAKTNEQKEFKKLAFLNVAKKYYEKNKILEINYDIFNIQDLNLDDFEKNIFLNKKAQEQFISFYRKLVNKLNYLKNEKELKVKEIEKLKTESTIKYKNEKLIIKKDFDLKIKEIEFSYNKEHYEQINSIKKAKLHANEKLNKNKEKIISLNQQEKEKINQIKLTEKEKLLSLKKDYLLKLKQVKILSKYETLYKKIVLINDLYNLNSEKVNLYFNDLKQKILSNLDYKKALDLFLFEKNNAFNLLTKDNSNKKIIITKIFNKNFNLTKLYWHKKNKLLYQKSLYFFKKSEILKNTTYESEYLENCAKAIQTFVKDFEKEIEISNNDNVKAINQLYLQNNNSKKNDINNIKLKINEANNEFLKAKNELKDLLKQKQITSKAYNSSLKKLKIENQEKNKEIKLENENYKNNLILKTSFPKLLYKKKITSKIYKSQILEAQKSIPIEANKFSSYKAFFLNLILPGSAELLIFKQNLKGLIMIIFSLLFYSVFLPFSFGLTWTKIGGIQGLVDLGAKIHDASKGITPDARYWMFGGVASLILLTITFSYIIASAISAWRNGKYLQQGMRPLNWQETKKWISNQGFPWMISIPGWFLIAFIVITPLFTSLLLSFSNTGFNHEPPGRTVDWVGFSQYGKWYIFRNNNLLLSLFRVISWTIIWTFSAGFLVIIVGSAFALLVNNHHIKFKKFFRLVYIIPWAIPAFVTIIFLKSIFQADADSLVNNILIKLGIIKQSINYFANVHTTRFLIIVIQTWLGHSYIFLLITGNLQSIPKDIYEAAAIDGANKKKSFLNITLPILLNSLTPLLIGQFIFMFNNFSIISLFSGGGPAYSKATVFLEGGTDIMISWIFKLTTGAVQIEGNTAFASALVILSSSISVGFAAYGFIKNTRKRS